MPSLLHHTAAVLRRELGRIARQPMYVVLMLLLPVLSFSFFALLFEKGVAHDIPIAVFDEDGTTLSRKIVDMIDATPTALVAYEVQDMPQAERLMREGRIMAIVQVPDFFEKNILSNRQTHGVIGIGRRLQDGFLDTLQRLLHLDVAGNDAVDGILIRQEVGTLVVDAAAIFEHIALGSLANTKDHGVLVVSLKDFCGLLFVANDKHSYPPLDVCMGIYLTNAITFLFWRISQMNYSSSSS